MPCPGFEGTAYIHRMVAEYYHNDWAAAFRAYVEDPKNRWCPKWIRHNYQMLNATSDEEAVQQSIAAATAEDVFNKFETDLLMHGSREC